MELVEVVETKPHVNQHGKLYPHWLATIRDDNGDEYTISMFDRAHYTLISNGYKRMADITRDNPATVLLGKGSERYAVKITDVWSEQVKGFINVEKWTQQENRRVLYGY